ncbi:MAG: ATPase, T2SS/T4P/T4SS family, partial [Bythopirellula sp.]
MSSDRVADYEKGAQVDLSAMGADDPNTNNANLLSARNSPGYLLVKEAVAEMVDRRCERMMFDFTKQAVNVRHEIDGMWHNGEAREREASDVMLAVMKTLANLDAKDRRNKQKGQFGAKYEEQAYFCTMVSQGVATGERVIITRTGKKQHFTTYEELGMREGLREKWGELMALDQGLLVVSTMPGGGLTTVTDVSLEETDRLMRDFAAIEDEHHREREIQNISVTTYDSAAGETPVTILPKLVRTYPNVYVCRDFVNVETAELLFAEVKDEDLVITTVRAREAAEALLRILQMKVSAKDFASIATAVLYQRMIRLLCPECKVGYTPPPDTLRKLGIPAGKVEQLYRPPKGEEIDKPCKNCQGLGYTGRTGILELLVVTDQMREILIKQPKLELLKKAAKASRQRSLQEEGVLLVAKGETSLPELMRVLKN